MADKTVSVKLTANTSGYVSAIKGAEAATKSLGYTGGTNFKKLGGQMHDVGQKMTLGVTLPIIGVGASAVKLSNDFNAAFGQMVGLAGVPADEVDRLKASVLALAGETAQAPQELAEGLYFAASAGLDSAQAMDAVTIAAKAAAAGMGTTQDIVGLAASAVASYGAANITSAEAVDILTSSIREGRADPAELAGSLGRILPIAASMNVGLAEVGGTVAYLSNIFGDTDRTVTSVNDAFAKLAAPTDGAREALARMGTSADELQSVIRDDGLLAGLELLRDHGFAGNSAAIRELMPDMQGAAALTALLNDESGTLAETLGAVENSTGSLDTAYGAIDKNAQKMKQSWVDIQVALIQVGEIVGPIIADIASGVAGLAGGFADLPGPVQTLVLAIAGLAAVAGPLLMVTGSLMRNFTQMRTTLAGSGGLVGAVTGVTAVITLATAAYTIYATHKQKVTDATNDFVTALLAERDGQTGASDAMLIAQFSGKEYADTLDHLGVSVNDIVRAIKGENVPALEDLIDKSVRAGHTNRGLSVDILNLRNDLELQRDAYAAGTAEVKTRTEAEVEGGRATAMYTEFAAGMRAELGLGTVSTEDLARSTLDLGDKAQNAGLKIGDQARVTEILAAAQEEQWTALHDLTVAYNEQIEAINDLVAKKLELVGGDIAVRQAQRDAQEAADELNASIADGTLAYGDLGPAIDTATLAQISAAQAAADQRAAQMEANGTTVDSRVEAQLLKEELQRLADKLDGPLKAAIEAEIALLDELATDRNANINFHITSSGLRIATNGALAIGGNVAAVSAEGVIARTPTFTAIAEREPEVVIPLSRLRASNTMPGNSPLPSNLSTMWGGSSSSNTLGASGGSSTTMVETHHHYHNYEMVTAGDQEAAAERRARGAW